MVDAHRTPCPKGLVNPGTALSSYGYGQVASSPVCSVLGCGLGGASGAPTHYDKYGYVFPGTATAATLTVRLRN